MKKITKILKWILIFLGVTITLLIIAYFVGKPIVEEYARSKGEESLTQSYGAEVNIESISLDIFNQSVGIENIAMTHPYKPMNNIVVIPHTYLTFDFKKWFSSETIYLSHGVLSDMEIDKARSQNKAGWVDEKKYPKTKSSSFDVKNIDLKALKKDFSENFLSELKKTTLYTNYISKKEEYENLIKDQYKPALVEFKTQLNTLKSTKISKDNLKSSLTLAKSLGDKLGLLKKIQGNIQDFKAEASRLNEGLIQSQSEILNRFLNKAGLGDVSKLIQDNLAALITKKDPAKLESQVAVKPQEQKTGRKGPREDILFFVNELNISGKNKQFKGALSEFHNREGEDPNLWEGKFHFDGEPLPKMKTMIKAVGANGGWDLNTNLIGLSLSQFDFIEGVNILDGLLNLNLKGSLDKGIQVSGLVDLELKKIASTLLEKQGKWGEVIKSALTSGPLKMSFAGNTPDQETSDMKWDLKWLSSMPSLIHPLRSEAEGSLKLLAQAEVERFKAKFLEVESVDKYREELENLKSKITKEGGSNLLKGLLKKL